MREREREWRREGGRGETGCRWCERRWASSAKKEERSHLLGPHCTVGSTWTLITLSTPPSWAPWSSAPSGHHQALRRAPPGPHILHPPFRQVTPPVDETKARFIETMVMSLAPGICEHPVLLLSPPGSHMWPQQTLQSLARDADGHSGQPALESMQRPRPRGAAPGPCLTEQEPNCVLQTARHTCLHTCVYVCSWVWPSGPAPKTTFYMLFPVTNISLRPAEPSPPPVNIPVCSSVPGLL